MANWLEAIPTAADSLPRKSNQKLAHLPGSKGHWLFGNVKELLPNLGPYIRKQRPLHGDCFTVGLFRNVRVLIMVGPKANEMVLLDRHNNFSSSMGWEALLAFFGRNILVRDFDDHRQHRRLMTHVFKPGALTRYGEQMNPIIESALTQYDGQVDVYRQTKLLALDIAVDVFAGIPAGSDTAAWNSDLSTVLSNAMALRIRLPGTAYSRGIAARNRLRKRLAAAIPERRTSGGADLFSQLACQQDEDGAQLTDSDIIDHMFGMLFAAHDTTASSLAMMFWLLAKHPYWQSELRAECELLLNQTGSLHLALADLAQLPKTDWVFKETLRLYSPIQLIPRRSVHEFEFSGHKIPANTAIYLVPQAVHFDDRFFAHPEEFNPARFADSNPHLRSDDPFAFIPFGRGSHMCLGMRFAQLEIKAVLYQMLLSHELRVDEEATAELEYLPIVRPTKPMMVHFTPLQE